MHGERYAGLDMLRVGLPIAGVVYHSCQSAVYSDGVSWLGAISIVTHAFRMETFFALAGLLAGPRLARDGYLGRRARILLVPTVFVSVLDVIRKPDRDILILDGGQGHLWFLLSLMEVSVVALIADRCGVFRRRWPIMLFAFLVWALGARMTGFVHQSFPFHIGETMALSVYYAPFFMIGVLASRHQDAAAFLYRIRYLWFPGLISSLGLMLLMLGGYASFRDREPALLELLFFVTTVTWVLGLLGLVLDRAITPSGRAIQWLAGAGFTVYLLHYSLIKVVFHTFPLASVGWKVASACAVAVIVPLMVHRLSERVPLLHFALSGTWPVDGRWLLSSRRRLSVHPT